MAEDIKVQPEEIIEEQPKTGLLEKLNVHKFKILGGVLGVFVLAGAVFGAYKFGQKQVQPGFQPTPTPAAVATPKSCDFYEMPMSEEEIKECICPDGYKKFYRLSGAYCATDSQKPCTAHADCPKGEHCISSDRKNWFCTGQFAGCYYRNPENPEGPMLCVD